MNFSIFCGQTFGGYFSVTQIHTHVVRKLLVGEREREIEIIELLPNKGTRIKEIKAKIKKANKAKEKKERKKQNRTKKTKKNVKHKNR